MPGTNGENRIRRSVLDNLVDLIILNILFVFSALPIFTYGASYNALYMSIRRLLNSKKYDPVAKYYWSVWKVSLKPTLPLWLLQLFVSAFLVLDYLFIQPMPGHARYCYMGFLLFLIILVQVTVIIALPVRAAAHLSIRKSIIYSLYALGSFPFKILLIVIVHLFPVIVLLLNRTWFAALFLVWEVIYFAFESYLANKLLDDIILSATQESSEEL